MEDFYKMEQTPVGMCKKDIFFYKSLLKIYWVS